LWTCQLEHGQRGFCRTHVNRNGILYNLSYGIISALDVGAIEDKPVRHYRPGSRILSVGSYGCSFRCDGCHNLDISWGVEALDKLARGNSRATYLSPKELITIAQRANVQGIAFTYSEPAIWLEYVLDVAKLAKDSNLYTVYVSNSFVTIEALNLIAKDIDVLCSDIKSMDDEFYREICRKSKVEDVLRSIKYAQELGIHVETRTNIIPGKNDDTKQIVKTAEWIYKYLGADSPWHLTRFFPAYNLSHIPATPPSVLEAARKIAQDIGLKNVYIYKDRGCDCAQTNLPVESYIENPELLSSEKKCAASCCGDDGILLKKFEREAISGVPI
tara:strand:+ start:176 stop:1165 length:990 start_codon:yes stop_codon:yes gene_type:complete